jgi:hypothetical protein
MMQTTGQNQPPTQPTSPVNMTQVSPIDYQTNQQTHTLDTPNIPKLSPGSIAQSTLIHFSFIPMLSGETSPGNIHNL